MRRAGSPGVLVGLGTLIIAAGVLLATVWLRGSGPSSPADLATPTRVAEEVPVTATDLVGKPANNSPLLAVDPTEPRFVVIANRLDAPFNCALQVSGDGGRGWRTLRPVPSLPSGADTCYAPEVAFDRDGVLYYLFVGLQGKGNSPMGAFLTTSSDRGRHFDEPHRILGGERYMVRMAIDRATSAHGRIHIVWLEARSTPPTGGLPSLPNPILAAFSDDGGKTFSTPVEVSDRERSRSVAPALALGQDGRVHVLYYDLRDDDRDYRGLDGPTWDGRWSLVVSTSNDGGGHFGPGVVVDADVAPPQRIMLIYTMPPAALVAGAPGHLYVAWHDARNGDWDVFMRRSSDGGRSWDLPVRLNDDALHNGRHQYLPRLSVAPSGRLDAIFYDRRVDPENVGTDVYYTYSSDGGRTFAPNVRLNGTTFSSVVGPRYLVVSATGLREFGSRLGLISEDDRVLAAWTDTRNSGPSAKGQDIFATEIDPPGMVRSDGPVWRISAGIGLVVAGSAVLAVALARRLGGPRWRNPCVNVATKRR